MRNIYQFSIITGAFFFLLTGCSTSDQVVGNGIFQKRKHTGGIYISHKGKVKPSETIAAISEREQKATVREEIRTEKEAASEQEAFREIMAFREDKDQVESAVENLRAVTVRTEAAEVQEPVVEQRAREQQIRQGRQSSVGTRPIVNERPPMLDDMQILCLILAIIIPPLGVLVYTNIDWTKVLISLLLTLLFILPGIIYSVLVVLDVF